MSSPVRLQKTEEKKSAMEKIENFVLEYAHILLPIFVFILLVLIVALVISIADISSTNNVSMVESGNYYYHLQDVI